MFKNLIRFPEDIDLLLPASVDNNSTGEIKQYKSKSKITVNLTVYQLFLPNTH